MFSQKQTIESVDPEVWQAIKGEIQRQEEYIELIASENYASPAVMQAQGSVLTNKYAEGYPTKRYYGGCTYADQVEQLAIDRLKALFGAEYVNVQPHSGSQANAAVYLSVLKPGDTLLGMSLAHGGHLTHGSSVSMSGKIFNSISYGLHPETELLDYDQVEQLAHEHKPKMIVAGASSYARVIDWKRFRKIADAVDAYLFVDMAHYAGLVAAGFYPNPVGIADFVTSTTHKTLRGPRGGIIMAKPEHEKALNSAIFPQTQGGPLMHVIAAKAVAFKEAMSPAFKRYQQQVLANARTLAQGLVDRGYKIVSGGTDTHLMLVNLTNKGITGKEADAALDASGIIVNKNAIPYDEKPPAVASGIRIGSPIVSTRGMREAEMREIVALIDRVLQHPQDQQVQAEVRAQAKTLCNRFPIFHAYDSSPA